MEKMHQLWDDTLNIVWGLPEANLNEAGMEVLRKEEREWIAAKDAEVQAPDRSVRAEAYSRRWKQRQRQT